MMRNNDFVVFILTHGRADRVITYNALRKSGYTGRIVLVIDNEDTQAREYISRYGKENVRIFDKSAVSETFDEGMAGDRRTIVYARNACFGIAEESGFRYFMELDDDYEYFAWRFDEELKYLVSTPRIKNLDRCFDILLDYYKGIPAKSIAISQGGDFIGGSQSTSLKSVNMKRKAMNTFICDVQRPFKFLGRINEDVNTYTRNTSTGDLFFQTNQLCITQKQTQSNSGGMTDVYLDSGTYVKSFFSVMYMPSSVKISTMGNCYKRIHHTIHWKHTAPKILREEWKK